MVMWKHVWQHMWYILQIMSLLMMMRRIANMLVVRKHVRHDFVITILVLLVLNMQ